MKIKLEKELERVTQSRDEYKRKWAKDRRARWKYREKLEKARKKIERLEREMEHLRHVIRKLRDEE